MPINVLLVRSLINLYEYYGDDFRVECPTGSGKLMNLLEVAQELNCRLQGIFVRNENGRRPVFGGNEKFQTDPYWKDYILFYEYFHGDNGAGIGASHQTGWTGTIAKTIQAFGHLTKADVLADVKFKSSKTSACRETRSLAVGDRSSLMLRLYLE